MKKNRIILGATVMIILLVISLAYIYPKFLVYKVEQANAIVVIIVFMFIY